MYLACITTSVKRLYCLHYAATSPTGYGIYSGVQEVLGPLPPPPHFPQPPPAAAHGPP